MEKMTKMNAFCKATVCQDCLKEFTKNNSLTRQMLFFGKFAAISYKQILFCFI